MLEVVVVTSEEKYLSKDGSKDKDLSCWLSPKQDCLIGILKASVMQRYPAEPPTVISATVPLRPAMTGLSILHGICLVAISTFYFCFYGPCTCFLCSYLNVWGSSRFLWKRDSFQEPPVKQVKHQSYQASWDLNLKLLTLFMEEVCT